MFSFIWSSQLRFERSLIIKSCQSSLWLNISSSIAPFQQQFFRHPSTAPSPPLILLFFLHTVPGASYSELEPSLRFEPLSQTASKVRLPLSGRRTREVITKHKFTKYPFHNTKVLSASSMLTIYSVTVFHDVITVKSFICHSSCSVSMCVCDLIQ